MIPLPREYIKPQLQLSGEADALKAKLALSSLSILVHTFLKHDPIIPLHLVSALMPLWKKKFKYFI